MPTGLGKEDARRAIFKSNNPHLAGRDYLKILLFGEKNPGPRDMACVDRGPERWEKNVYTRCHMNKWGSSSNPYFSLPSLTATPARLVS